MNEFFYSRLKNVVPDCKQSKCPRILIRVRVTQPDACETKTERHVVLPAKLVCVTENYSIQVKT